MILNIFIGVFSGILTALILYIMSQLINKILIPWYQELKYEGVDISGNWDFEANTGDKWGHISLNIEQNAHSIKGLAIMRRATDSNKDGLQYSISGTLWEGYLSFTMKTIDRTKISFGTMLLKVANGGRNLEGSFSYRQVLKEIVETQNLKFERRKL